MASTEYQFKVEMPCEGCSNAVRRSLTKTYGSELTELQTNLDTQLVTITLTRDGEPYSYEQVYQSLLKSGKTVTKLQ